MMEANSKKEADRAINIAYMLSGVLEQSFKSMDIALDKANKRLVHEDRRLINAIRTNLKHLTSNIEALRRTSLNHLDEEVMECYDDTVLRFYVIFMKLLEIAGIDELCDLRLYSLYKKLEAYQSKVIYPGLDYNSTIAFLQVKRDIDNGMYSVDDLKNVFKLKDENGNKEIESSL